MASSETSLQWKLISQKTKFKVLVISLIIITIGFGFAVIVIDSCPVNHIILLEQIKKYDNSLDPELCIDILEQIDFFNESCEPKVEILDCG